MNVPIRVLHVITRLDPGGSAENTLLTVARLDESRFEVHLAVGKTAGDPGPTLDEARTSGVALFEIPELVRAIAPLADWRALHSLRRIMRGNAYDIVHTHTSKAGILGRLAARLEGVPRIAHTPHGHVFYGYYGAVITAAIRLARALGSWLYGPPYRTDAGRPRGPPSLWDCATRAFLRHPQRNRFLSVRERGQA